MRNAGLDDSQTGIKIVWRNINDLRYADDTTLMAESKEELKSLLMKVKEESENAGLKLNIQKTKIMASSPITLWLNLMGKRGNSDRFYFLGLQNHCVWWLQPWNSKTFSSWKKSYAKEHIKNQRHHFSDKVPYSQSYGFYSNHVRCESWTIMKAESQRIDPFELWCWRRLLRVPWTTRRPNQSILKEIYPEYSLKGLMLKLKLQYLGQLMQRAHSLGNTLMLGDWGQEEKGATENEMLIWHHWLMDMNLSKLQEMVKDREVWCAAVHGVTKNWTWLSNWTTQQSVLSLYCK